uniref:Calponin-homology (CH) domain-containing protein n=1 Tax=Mustela putorius furo TaxID=9669 RepID=M3Z3K8_MUSPF
MASRGPAYSLSWEVEQKIEKQPGADPDPVNHHPVPQGCGLALAWVGELQNRLKDGMVLCELINRLYPKEQAPGKNIQASTRAFKVLEQIQFLQAAKHCGINTIDIFQTADIWEEKNIAYMQWMLMNLGGLVVAQDNGLFSGDPNCFPKKSKEPWNFSDNQLQEGKIVIGLQMGSNCWASQARMPCQIL